MVTDHPDFAKIVEKIFSNLESEDRDLFLYSGAVDKQSVNELFKVVLGRKDQLRSNVSLILTTWGGDPHQAYRMARLLQKFYSNFRVVVMGPCKSAGTLVTIGANELAFGFLGELGPLDMQLYKPDEIGVINSGLDTLGALAIMRNHAFAVFEDCMMDIINKSRGTVSMKTASDVASQLVIGLFQPIVRQIDPHRFSEVNRMMKITKEYGKRLGMPNLKDEKESRLDNLIEDYPTHEFIIDKYEAETIFETVLDASELEQSATMIYMDVATRPSHEAIIIDMEVELKKLVVEPDKENMLESNVSSREKAKNGKAKTHQAGQNTQRTSRKSSSTSRKGKPSNNGQSSGKESKQGEG